MNVTKPKLPETVAAIDLGSNSFHMIVARLETSGTLSIIDRLRESVRLGDGLDASGAISESSLNKAYQCLETFSQRICDLPNTSVRIAGTNTLRIASNAQAFVEKAETILNHPIEIIAGREEARLIYLGVAHGLATTEGKRLVIDIGGGSTEFIIGENMQPSSRESIAVGCVSANNRYFDNGEITEDTMHAAEVDARLALLPNKAQFIHGQWNEAIGCSGTIKAIAKIVEQQQWSSNGISYQSLLKLRAALLDAKHINNVSLAGLSEGRKPVITGGLSVLIAIFKTLKIEHIRVSEQSMREGLLYDLVGRITHQDVRDASVEAAMTRWSVDTAQAKRISKTVSELCDIVAPQWSIDLDKIKPLVLWASMLHEIGLQVSHNNYHKHGAYILGHADLQGFSKQEQALLAALVQSHRSKFRTDSFKTLMSPFTQAGEQLCIVLRLAVLLHRGRTDTAIPEIDITVNDKDISLTFPEEWLKQHSMTHADLNKEIKFLNNTGYQLSFS